MEQRLERRCSRLCQGGGSVSCEGRCGACAVRPRQPSATPDETTSLPSLIAQLNGDLKLPAASDPAVRLRILEVKGRCEEEYDAGLAANTFAQVESLAIARHRLYLASRASGERGIMLFTLGKFDEAKGLVMRSYFVASYLHDPAADVRFASMIGRGLTQMDRPKQALKYLDEAITTQKRRNPKHGRER